MRTFAGPGGSAWDDVVGRVADPHLLQGHDWGALKSRWGWRVHRLVWGADDAPTAVAQVLVRRVWRSPFVVAYVPKGPLLAAPASPAAWRDVLADLAAWSRASGHVLLKIDPDVPADLGDVADAWRRLGWRPSSSPVQFPHTMTSDLTGGLDALLAGMHAKTRYNLRLAERRGVTVSRRGAEAFAPFHDMYVQTGARGGFALRAREYYLDAWASLLAAGRATVILSERDGRPLAGVIPVDYGDTAWYLYGASADAGREHMGAYLAQWESLRWAVERGRRIYDWWGGPTVLDASDPLWGVYRFKLGFGAVWRAHLGAWDLPVDRLGFAVFDRLERWRRRRRP